MDSEKNQKIVVSLAWDHRCISKAFAGGIPGNFKRIELLANFT